VAGRSSVVAIIALLVVACGSVKGPERTRMTTKEIISKYKPAIVRVVSPLGIGTGFFVSGDGKIVTNLHVIQGASELAVVLSDDTQLEVTRVIAVDEAHDLAIIQVSSVSALPTLRLGDSDSVEAGDRVIAIGNPLGVLDYTVSDGLISSVRSVEGNKVLQISAPISVGSSGGPLFNPYGEVIGIATFIAQQGQNLNFGMPSNYIKPLLASRAAGLSVAEFAGKKSNLAKRLSTRQGNGDSDPNNSGNQANQGDQGKTKITRSVPRHAVAMLDSCNDDILVEMFQSISQAIELGAPVYNRGEHEACFVIYRKVVEKFETDTRVCSKVRDALGAGLLRAGSIDETDFTAKAWALRDTFDGLLDVIVRKARSGQSTGS
jgi:S1-C subfamily serine protease